MDSVEMEKIWLVAYSEIFGDLKVDPSEILTGIPKVEALEFISYLLHLYNVRKKEDTDFQYHQLIRWMLTLESPQKNVVAAFVEKYKSQVFSSSFKLIDRRPFLDLIQHILIHSSPDSRTLTAEDYTILFKCLLHFNSIENKAQEKLFHWNGEGGIQKYADYIMAVEVRNIEHERFKYYVVQFLKVYYFFTFCESHGKYSAYLKSFLLFRGLPSYPDYLYKILYPYLKLILNEPPTPKMHLGLGDLVDFYDRLAINENINSIDKDYKALRLHPLFRLEENIYLFLDYRFFVDKIYQGLLFDFCSTVNIPYNDLKSDMGNEYSEHILFYSIMSKCFNEYGEKRLTGEQIKTKLGEGEPDYYIRQGADIFLFEFKDAVISVETKYSGNAGKIKDSIAEKFVSSPAGKRKGVAQLLHTIKLIADGLYKSKDIDTFDTDQVVFYPILIHTDITLESCGINYFLNQRMNEIKKEMGISQGIVKDLIVANLDTFISLQDYFSNGKLELKESAESYFKYISSGDPLTATFPFDEFIKYHFVEINNESIVRPKDFDRIIAYFKSKS